MNLALRYPPRYTVKDYLRWEGDWELIEGIPYALASPSFKHQRIVGKIFRHLDGVLEKKCPNCVVGIDTDYIAVFKKAMDTKSKVQCLINLKSGKVENLSECAENSELERYVLQTVKTYLVNDKEISHLVEERVIPYANRRVEEFKKNTFRVVR